VTHLDMCAVHVPCRISKQPVHYVAVRVDAINDWKCCLKSKKQFLQLRTLTINHTLPIKKFSSNKILILKFTTEVN